ncbi:MAG: sel1 repeat family protein, partial [Alphaproteobacteria bacterium]|nr:sel1 repeat family protein [Alphaproteobacteria bacterium]
RWLELAAEAGDRIAIFDLGMAATEAEGGVRVIAGLLPRLRALAEEGDPVAAYNLAVCLHHGSGIAADPHEARLWLERAAPHVVNAAYWLGRLLVDGAMGPPAPEAALPWLRRAAAEGMPDAVALLADMTLNGLGLPADAMAALELFIQAAHSGHAGAAFACGALLGGGHAVPEDRPRAERFFRQAAQQGHPRAQMMLGRYLLRGLGGTQDAAQAAQWLEKAAAQGVDEARAMLEAAQ